MSSNFLLHAFQASQALSKATSDSYSVAVSLQGSAADIVKQVNENQSDVIEQDQLTIRIYTGDSDAINEWKQKFPSLPVPKQGSGKGSSDPTKSQSYSEGYDKLVRKLNEDQTTWGNYGKSAENNVNIISDEVRRDNSAKENLQTYLGCIFDVLSTLTRSLSS